MTQTLFKIVTTADLDGLRSHEPQFLEHVNELYKNKHDIEEDFAIYWACAHQDKEKALYMFEIMLNTIHTAWGDYFQDVMFVMAKPAMMGAVLGRNTRILDILVTFLDDDDIRHMGALIDDVGCKNLLRWNEERP
jgi:hypothetical protein